jgi:hypothetical protein
VNVAGPATEGFSADQQYRAGDAYGHTTTGASATGSDPVTGTDLDAIYQTVRFRDHGYSVDLENGDYTVVLHFAEFWRSEPGERVFRVDVEGTTVEVDVIRDAGRATALTVAVSAAVRDGQLSIDLRSTVGDPTISAIEVLEPGAVSGAGPRSRRTRAPAAHRASPVVYDTRGRRITVSAGAVRTGGVRVVTERGCAVSGLVLSSGR